MTVAALFVATNGVYYGLPDVQPWGVEADATRYDGPWPVVAHPPCARWGKYWHGYRGALPELIWGPSVSTTRLDLGFHSAEERARFAKPSKGMSPADRAARRVWLREREDALGKVWCAPERMNKTERAATPPAFRDLLLSIAEQCRGDENGD